MIKTLFFQLCGMATMLLYTYINPTYALHFGLATLIGYSIEILSNQRRK